MIMLFRLIYQALSLEDVGILSQCGVTPTTNWMIVFGGGRHTVTEVIELSEYL